MERPRKEIIAKSSSFRTETGLFITYFSSSVKRRTKIPNIALERAIARVAGAVTGHLYSVSELLKLLSEIYGSTFVLSSLSGFTDPFSCPQWSPSAFEQNNNAPPPRETHILVGKYIYLTLICAAVLASLTPCARNEVY
jgi:hypothetical protein